MPPLPCTRERFAFRSGKSTLTPYYRVPLSLPDRPLKLSEIVVGPTPHIKQSISAVKNFLTRWNYITNDSIETVPVNRSAVPYRNW